MDSSFATPHVGQVSIDSRVFILGQSCTHAAYALSIGRGVGHLETVELLIEKKRCCIIGVWPVKESAAASRFMGAL